MNRQLVTASIIAFFIGVVATLLVVSALLPVSVRISSSATIKTVGVAVYWDPEFTMPIESINWGVLEPGQTKNVTTYIVNTSNVPTVLTFTTSNWAPTNASNFISLSWDYDGHEIPVGGYVPITFSLHVDPTTSGITSFSFNITIMGSG